MVAAPQIWKLNKGEFIMAYACDTQRASRRPTKGNGNRDNRESCTLSPSHEFVASDRDMT
jgi:hypothetical protein